MIQTAHIYDCFLGTAQATLESMSLGIHFTATKKSLLRELEADYPDLLVVVFGNFYHATECCLAGIHRRFPHLPVVHLVYAPFPIPEGALRDLFLVPNQKTILPLSEVTGLRFMYTVIDTIEEARSRRP